MAEQLFTTELGYKIENEAGDTVDVLLVNGIPGATTLTDAAAVGSLALSDNGGHYRKATAGTGTDKWESTSSSQAVTDVQNEVDALEAALGAVVDANGDYVAHTGTNYINANANLTADLLDLDAAAGNIQTEVDAIEGALGAMVGANGAYVAHTGTNFINANADVAEDLTDLDTAIQAVSDDSLSRTGDSMDSAANLTFSGGGEVLGLPATPSGDTAATSKAYVDQLVSAGATWRNPIVDPSVVDVVATEPGAPVLHDAYIVSAGGTWTGIGAVVAGDLVYWDGAAWVLVENLQIGDRFIVSGETATTAGAGITGMGFADNALLEVVATGAWLTAGSYSEPDGTAGVDMPQGITVLASDPDSDHYGHTYLYDATANAWVEIAGPGAVGAGVGLAYAGNVLNINMGAGIVELPSDEVGLDVHASGGLQTTVDGTTSSTTTAAQLAVKLADTSLTLAAGGLSVGSEVTDPIAALITTLGAAVNAAGVYQARTGTNYIDGNASIDADLLDLDTAIDAVSTVASGAQTEIDAIETALGAMVDVNGDYVAFSATNYLDAATDVTGALTALDTAVDANATAIGNNTSAISTQQTEINTIETGAGLDTDGTYIQPIGSNYLDATTDLADADLALDTALDAVATLVTANDTELGHIRAFIGKGAAGAEDPVYTNNWNVTANADLETAVDELDTAIGNLANLNSGFFVSGSLNVQQNITQLDSKLAQAHGELVNKGSSVSWIAIDSVPTSTRLFVKWLIHARLGTNVITWEVDATHNGGDGGTPAATVVDFTRFAKLKIGAIAGLKVQVVLNGSNMELQVQDTAGTAVVNAVREVIVDQ